jgi:hypothetical protein
MSGNATKGAGTIQMVRWEPGKEAYPGSGVHAGYRSYINIGADDSANPVHYNYCNYTDASLRLFLNEVAFLACGEIRKSECISPSISGQPQGITAIAGTQAEVAVTASGTNLSYQWFKNGTEITGAGSAVYTISSVSSGDAGTYYVKVSGSCGSPAVSAQASIIVCSVPVITLNPQNVTGEAGSTVSFSVNASGTGLTYQWRKDGSNIAGATSETCRISNIQSSNEGSYSVIVSGSCGSPVTSNSASLTVTPQVLLAADYYVATNGSDSNPGTFDRPFATWQKGFNALSAGQTLCIRGGTYYANSTTFGSHYCGVVVDSKQGTASSKYMVVAYPGEKPVLDCRNIKGTSYRRYGIYLTRCEYWHLKGLEITRVDQVSTGGFYIGAGLEINRGNHNTIENCVSHHNGGYGFGTREEAYNTLFLNCDSYSNFDQYSATPGDDADGWDVGYASGNPIITLEGCRSWNNGDDGFDMYQGSGYSGIYYLKNCWSWHNGYRPDGITAGGNGCGFKYGLDGQSYDGVTRRYTYNCIAYDNRKRGFSQESANIKKIFYNCISYNNHAWGWSFWGIDLPDILRNNIAFGDGIEQPGSTRISDHNSWNGGVTVTSADFMSIDGSELLLPRKEDGSLPDIKFLKLNTGSDLIGAGIDVGLPYFGYHPDLGPFESTDLTKGESIENITDNSGSKNEEELFRIYPNPVHDRLNILWNSAEGNILVRLFSSTGIKLYEGIVTGDSFIDMSSYPSGMYVLHVYGGGEFRMMKIVK